MAAASPLPLLPDTHIILPPQLLPHSAVYALIAAVGRVTVDCAMRFDKRFKQAHRYTIADTRGQLRLTLPICKPHGRPGALWSDVSISDHDGWWTLHRTAWASAYGRTPYYEFYADDFEPLFAPVNEGEVALHEYIRLADSTVRRLAMITTPVHYRTDPAEPIAPDAIDLRRISVELPAQPYWQVRGETLGFIPELSVIDMLFNLGPEMLPALLERVEHSQLIKHLEAGEMTAAL